MISDGDESRGQVKCDGNNLPFCFSVLHVSFLSILSQYDRLNQSTNYTADQISAVYITTTMLCFESQAIRSRGCRSAKRKNNCTLRLHYFTYLIAYIYFVYLVFGAGSGYFSVCTLIFEIRRGVHDFHYSEMP